MAGSPRGSAGHASHPDRQSNQIIYRLDAWPVTTNAIDWLLKQTILTSQQLTRLEVNATAQATAGVALMAGGIEDRIKRALAESFQAGEGQRDWVKRITGIVDIAESEAATIGRTFTHRAYHAGVSDVLKNPAVRTEFPYRMWLGTGDARERDEHVDLNDKVAHVGSPLAEEMEREIKAWNCRCSIVSLSREDAEAKGIDDDTGWNAAKESKKDTDKEVKKDAKDERELERDKVTTRPEATNKQRAIAQKLEQRTIELRREAERQAKIAARAAAKAAKDAAVKAAAAAAKAAEKAAAKVAEKAAAAKAAAKAAKEAEKAAKEAAKVAEAKAAKEAARVAAALKAKAERIANGTQSVKNTTAANTKDAAKDAAAKVSTKDAEKKVTDAAKQPATTHQFGNVGVFDHADIPIKVEIVKSADGAVPNEKHQKEIANTLKAIPNKILESIKGKPIVMSVNTTDADPSLKGVTPRGWSEGTTWDDAEGLYHKQTGNVVSAQNRSGKPTDRAAGVLRHELGHAFDAQHGVVGNISFAKAYNEDVAELRRLGKDDLFAYEIQPGFAGKEEAAAELFGMLNGGGAVTGEGFYRNIYTKYWPNTLKAVQEIIFQKTGVQL